MASQEFLASYAVEIDEAGVSRLQAVLEETRELAESLASAFESITRQKGTWSERCKVRWHDHIITISFKELGKIKHQFLL